MSVSVKRPTTAQEVDDWLAQLDRAGTPRADVLALLNALSPAPADPIFTRVYQQCALRLSKYSNLPPERRHPQALAILRDRLDLARTQDRETLGIAGGICKRMWLDDGQRVHLDAAVVFYSRGHRSPDPGNDFYTSINAAFLEELIAEQELVAGFEEDAVSARHDRAGQINQDIINAAKNRTFIPKTWWHYATVADADLGGGDSGSAAQWFRDGADACPDTPGDYKLTSLRQSAHLMQLQARRRGEPWERTAESDLAGAFQIDPQAVRAAVIGKVGLAFSGGGFRASLFHIGVLARLAEVDLLRHVEVLSCVSGGSIVGAKYYLELRERFAQKDHLDRSDYINIVHALETDFLQGVQTNIRTSAAADLKLDLKMLFDAEYSRTERVAELYEEKLFTKPGASAAPLFLNDLKIFPNGDQSFHPASHNWLRASKVPILILNSTTLNTGHQWQFTTSGMGEPPYTRAQLDAVEIIPRRRYATGEKMLLSRAVAASAGVPGLFAPVLVKGDGGRAIRLVDGGVHDNQGIASLDEQECKTVLVSDASGQLASQRDGGAGVVAPLLRANSILQARLRESQIVDLLARRRAGLLQGFTFVHMTMGLDNNSAPATPTSYGVRQDLQKMLAELRTDLDTFTDAEGYSLMLSGYRMMTEALGAPLTSPRLAAMAAAGQMHPWDFLRVGNALDGSDAKASQRLYDILSESGSATRARRPVVKIALTIVAILLVALILILPWILILPLLAVGALAHFRRKPFDEVIVGLLLSTAGFIASNLYLVWYEPAERKRGGWE